MGAVTIRPSRKRNRVKTGRICGVNEGIIQKNIAGHARALACPAQFLRQCAKQQSLCPIRPPLTANGVSLFLRAGSRTSFNAAAYSAGYPPYYFSLRSSPAPRLEPTFPLRVLSVSPFSALSPSSIKLPRGVGYVYGTLDCTRFHSMVTANGPSPDTYILVFISTSRSLSLPTTRGVPPPPIH